jgi:hypothetical protein
MAETLIMAVMGLPRPWQELTLLLRGVFVTNLSEFLRFGLVLKNPIVILPFLEFPGRILIDNHLAVPMLPVLYS